MDGVEMDEALFGQLTDVASAAELKNTLDLLPEGQRQTTYLFLCALACRSEDEYIGLKERLSQGRRIDDEFGERLALVVRAFCIGHDWVLNNWGLWRK